MDRIFSIDNLRKAFKRVEENKGAPGIDGETIDEFRFFLEDNLADLKLELESGSYHPQPVRRVEIDKPGSTEKRPLGIPTVRDRVVQAALLQELEPLFEPRFADNSYGFRPDRNAIGALSRVEGLRKAGYGFVVEADIEKYFDSIPHEPLLDLVRAVVNDEHIIGLIRAFLKAGVMENDIVHWPPGLGTPQGGVFSPLLANIYLNPLDHLMMDKGNELVRYADDFVIMCRCHDEAEAALQMVSEWMSTVGLTLHPRKTGIIEPTKPGGFDFLGYHLDGERHWPRDKSIAKLKDSISEKTKRCRKEDLTEIIGEVNKVLTGWFEYFKQSTEPFHDLDSWVASKLRSNMRSRHRVGSASGLVCWPDVYFRDQGLFSLVEAHSRASREWD